MSDQRRFSNQRQPDDDVPLTTQELQTLVLGLVRFPTMFKSARRVGFDANQFNNAGEDGLRAFVAVYTSLAEQHETVTKTMLLTALIAGIENTVLTLSPASAEFLLGQNDDGFIDEAFSPAEQTPAELRAERQYVESILRRFLNARYVKQELKRIVSYSNDNTSPVGFSTLMEQWTRKVTAIQHLGNEAVNAAVMPNIGEKIVLPPRAVPTTISWIDNYIGGFRAGDVIGLLGPYSGGKTTMLSTVAVRMAQQYAANNENKLSVYICYEDGAEKVNYSLYSAAAHIERRVFVDKTPDEVWASMSDRDHLKAYERNIPVNANAEILLGERERWMAAQSWFNQNFVFLDFSAAGLNSRGNGGVDEIAATLENLADRMQMQIGFVAIDYAALLVNRAMSQQASTKYMEQVWRPLQMLPDELKTKVGIPFGAAILLAHQLAGSDIKNVPPYRHVHHFDAQGSKAFAENLHACVCLNAPDHECRVSTIHWSKIRFGRPQRGPYGLVQIDENVVDVRDVYDEYYINDFAKKIMRKNETAPTAHNNTVVAPSATRRRVMPDIDSFGSEMLQ